MPVPIQLNRGAEAGIPTLASGEPGWTTDTFKLFVGDGATNHQIGDALVSGTLAQFAATTSASLAGVISDETGTGLLVFNDSPTFVTPTLGAATATSINGVTITGSGTLDIDTFTLTLTGNADVEGTNTGDQTAASLGLVIGTDVQAWDAQLDTLAAVTPVADGTYTVGYRLTPGGTDGTITTSGGLITAITEAT